MLSILPECGWQRSSYSCPDWLLLVIQHDDIVVVIARQVLAHLPVADDEGIVNLAEVSDLDHVSELCNFAVFREFDTVGLVCALDFLGIFTVVYQLQLCEQNHCSGWEEEVRERELGRRRQAAEKCSRVCPREDAGSAKSCSHFPPFILFIAHQV